jgi:hypothetical protein
MDVAQRLVAVGLILTVGGCVGPDESLPHTLRVLNHEDHAIAGSLVVWMDGTEVHNLTLDLPRGAEGIPSELHSAFGPVRSGNYRIVAMLANGTQYEETRQMGRGGWAIYVSFTEGTMRVSTLHGD